MNKTVLNLRIVALILLFSSCFAVITSNAQTINAISSTAFANVDIIKSDIKSDHATTVTANKKRADTDTSWKPVRRLWGYALVDFYYNAHADAANRGTETNYNGVPAYRNAFQFRRTYLGYDYDINKKFSVEVLLASEPSANTGVVATTAIANSDNLVDNKMAFFIKNFALRWKGVWNGTDFVIGEMFTPGFVLTTEKIWGYRSIEKTVADFHRTNSYDVGAALQGVFDPATKNFGYNLMIGNNSISSLLSAANANSGFFKAFYGDVYAKFLDQKLIFDFYADYMQTASSTALIGVQSHQMFKGFVAYTTPKLTVGVEAYTQKIVNGVTNTTTNTPQDATVEAISVYAHGPIYKDKLNFFARYDGYNPDNNYNVADTYTINTNFPNYSPATKEHFYTAGLDFTPAKNVHIEPNVWFIQYKDQRTPSTAGYVPDGHVLVYRLTFYFLFGR
jgi:hypothetical protein